MKEKKTSNHIKGIKSNKKNGVNGKCDIPVITNGKINDTNKESSKTDITMYDIEERPKPKSPHKVVIDLDSDSESNESNAESGSKMKVKKDEKDEERKKSDSEDDSKADSSNDDDSSSAKSGSKMKVKKGEKDEETKKSDSEDESKDESSSDDNSSSDGTEDGECLAAPTKAWEEINNFEYTKKENRYFSKNYKHLQRRLEEKMTQCTACYDQINHNVVSEVFTHPDLGVLICKKCFKFYGKGEFKKDKEGYDEYCRWCANGGDLLLCDKCPNGFCKKCVKRNLGRSAEKEVVESDSWNCYMCNSRPLIELKMQLRFIILNIKNRNTIKKKMSRSQRKDYTRKEKFSLKLRRKMKGLSCDNKKMSSENRSEIEFLYELHNINQDAAEQISIIDRRWKEKTGEARFAQMNRRTFRLINVLEQNLSSLKIKIKENTGLGDNDLSFISQHTQSQVKEEPTEKNIPESSAPESVDTTEPKTEETTEPNAGETKISPSSSKKRKRVSSSGEESEQPPGKKNSMKKNNNIAEESSQQDGCNKTAIEDEMSNRKRSNDTSNEASDDLFSDNDKASSNSPVMSEDENKTENSTTAKMEESECFMSQSILENVTQNDYSKSPDNDKDCPDSSKEGKEKRSTSTSKESLLKLSKKKKVDLPNSMEEISDLEFTEVDGERVVKSSKASAADDFDEMASETITDIFSENEEGIEKMPQKSDKEDKKNNGTQNKKSNPSDDENESDNNNKSVTKENEKSSKKKLGENDLAKLSLLRSDSDSDSEPEIPLKKKPNDDENESDNNDKSATKVNKKSSKKKLGENELAKLSLLRSDSDSETEISVKKRTKKKQKRKYKARPKSKQDLRTKKQIKNGIVKVEKLSLTVIKELEEAGYIDVSDYPQIMNSVDSNSCDVSDDELDRILRFNPIKSSKKSDKEVNSDLDDENGETKPEKCRKINREKKEKQKGLLDISIDNQDEEMEDDDDDDDDKDEKEVNLFPIKEKKRDKNEELKDALLATSDEDAESDSNASKEESSSSENEVERRKRYDEKKKKLKETEEKKEEEGEDEDEEESIGSKKPYRKGYMTFNFSSDEDEGNGNSNEPSPVKPRMFVDSDSDFETSKNTKKSGLFEESSSEESSNSSSSDSEDKKKKKPRRFKRPPSSSEDEQEPAKQVEEDTPSKKKHRRIIRDEDLLQSTKDATQEENDRRERVKERQGKYNKFFEIDVEQDQVDLKKLILDFDESTKKELVKVNDKLLSSLKPHQVKGIRFMWDASIESMDRLEKGEKGGGCVLAHCMGLGKTLQVITLVHTLLTNKIVNKSISRVMVCCPVNTVYNWVAEFNQWLKGKMLPFDVVELISARNLWARAYRLDDWYKEGGVCIVGYDMFRNLSNVDQKKYKGKMKDIFQKCLVSPGPDVMICDEGHILKNEKTALSLAINKISTRRRIVLTGTPLQNNLKEYHCMIQFVKPNLLGSKKEFMNRFVNPIEAGQCIDAVPKDVRRMKRRAHILHNKLEGCVQRFDYTVLKPFLPPKFEYVISVQMCEVQCKLYSYYLSNLAQGGPKRSGSGLFVDFNNLNRIWSHPAVLYLALKRREKSDDYEEDEEDEEEDGDGNLTDFIDDGSDSSSSERESKRKKKTKQKKGGKKEKEEEKGSDEGENGVEIEEIKEVTETGEANNDEGDNQQLPGLSSEGKVKPDWWRTVLHEISGGAENYNEDEFLNRITIGGKLFLLIDILRECSAIGDKVLLFSQSILVLDMIENFLSMLDSSDIEFPSSKGEDDDLAENLSWQINKDYLRLDGSTSADTRKYQMKYFNNLQHEKCRLFLISTRAGGVGINLVAANRVIIFDSSWNPSHDTQSIFRIYRFGQKKPCYIYRFVAQGTMEEKIYSRQVNKISTSLRVVDEHQIKRYFKTTELSELYEFTPADLDVRETPSVPEDRLLAELLIRNKDYIVKYHEQDSLLENQTGEELSEEERKAAWDDYENEKKVAIPMVNKFNAHSPLNFGSYVSPFNVEEIFAFIKTNNPNITSEQWKESALISVQQIQRTHLSQFQGLQGYIYNLKNPMIAPEIMRQMPSMDPVVLLANLERQSKLLEKNIFEENKVIQRLSMIHNEASRMAPNASSSNDFSQYVSRPFAPRPGGVPIQKQSSSVFMKRSAGEASTSKSTKSTDGAEANGRADDNKTSKKTNKDHSIVTLE